MHLNFRLNKWLLTLSTENVPKAMSEEELIPLHEHPSTAERGGILSDKEVQCGTRKQCAHTGNTAMVYRFVVDQYIG